MIFVFGSNLAGRHGAGAAAYAYNHEGAVYGQGIGHFGNSYAIPTKDHNIQTMELVDIQQCVELFIQYAELNPDLKFKVTRIGCGLAGYKDEDIAPMFSKAPSNCWFDQVWFTHLPEPNSRNYWGTM
ncbi:hypothetical protein HWB52_gp39 [Pseudomonas phage Littlefix]|uniref:Uncharacterized protein n=1 Tax=Pseudomonas phage Littlefix TaxID=2079289 RepID=A0A2K9VHN2_9CAUD|nr:hypothetical protein HWB52_gp39 [Pseudomonas phage Littlefix]AUV61854.1 hypothetical protein PsPhLittlefix_gp39 [Pseudomonas phage Littlefix]